MRLIILFTALLWSTSAFTQQQAPDPAFLQRVIVALEQQRTQALTAQAIAEARVGLLSDELIKVNARIKELEPKPDTPAIPEK